MFSILRSGIAGALKLVLRVSASVAAAAILIAMILGVILPAATEAFTNVGHLSDPGVLSKLVTCALEAFVAAVLYIVTLKLCLHGAAVSHPGELIGSIFMLYVSDLLRNYLVKPAPPDTGWLITASSGVAYASLVLATITAFAVRVIRPHPSPPSRRWMWRHPRIPPPPPPPRRRAPPEPRAGRSRVKASGAAVDSSSRSSEGASAAPGGRSQPSRDFIEGLLRSGVPGLAGRVSRVGRRSGPFTLPEELLASLKGVLRPGVGEESAVKCWLIGCGGWGCVYECVCGGRSFALKVHRLFRDVVEGGGWSGELPTVPESVLRRVESEVRVLAGLSHPNLVGVLAYSTCFPAVAYEFVWGGTLRRYLGFVKGDVRSALVACVQVGDALRYLHSRGLVHGDVKPGNVLVRRDGGLKVGDYSSVRRLIETASASGGTACTPGYCAPEQVFSDLLRKAVDAGMENRVDVYQLGNLMLEMLTGEALDGRDVVRRPAEVRALLKGVGCGGLASLIAEMMSPDPRDRPSAEEVVRRAAALLKSGCGGP